MECKDFSGELSDSWDDCLDAVVLLEASNNGVPERNGLTAEQKMCVL